MAKVRGETVFKIDLKYLESADGQDACWHATRWFDGAPQVFVGSLEHVLAEVKGSVQWAEPGAEEE